MPFLAANEVVGHERTIDPRNLVRVRDVDFAERRAELADLREQAAGQRRKRDEPFFEIDPFLAEGQEEIGAGIRIDNRLQRHLRFRHLQDRIGIDLVFPAAPTKLPITATSGLKIFDAADTLP